MSARRSEPVRLARPLGPTPGLTRARRAAVLLPLLLPLLLAACERRPSASAGPEAVLRIGGIPDQDVSRLERTFGLMASYLERRTGLSIEYVPSNDYAALVSAFQRGDVQLAWFGGLTGVQAREMTPDAHAVAQRPRDAEFHSVFIVGADVRARSLAELSGLSFTFGSESSTSGHLMPRHFLTQAGVAPDTDFAGEPGYSGSHDATYKLVESGAFQAGALNEAVWETAVREARVDTTRVRMLERSPAFYDYHWALRGDVDERFGAGTAEALTRALMELRPELGAEESELMALFATDRFVAAADSNYAAIREVAQGLGILR